MIITGVGNGSCLCNQNIPHLYREGSRLRMSMLMCCSIRLQRRMGNEVKLILYRVRYAVSYSGCRGEKNNSTVLPLFSKSTVSEKEKFVFTFNYMHFHVADVDFLTDTFVILGSLIFPHASIIYFCYFKCFLQYIYFLFHDFIFLLLSQNQFYNILKLSFFK